MKLWLLIICILFSLPVIVRGQLRLPKIIASNMVLQRDKPLLIWGWATPGKAVGVKFAGQQKEARANNDGYWAVHINSLSASSIPAEMVVSSVNSTITLSNILVGDVWLASGQSNMEYMMKNDYAKPAKGIDSLPIELNRKNSQIRLFKVDKISDSSDVATRGWNESGGIALAEFSAPAYYFAKNLQNKLHIPIGIISSAWNGSRIESWIPVTGDKDISEYITELADTSQSKGNALLEATGYVAPGEHYNKMIKPLAPFAISGFIWYQGETNCMFKEREMGYADKMTALIDRWRKAWGNSKLPFYYVLIAPHKYTMVPTGGAHTAETLPEFWEQQIVALKIPHTEIINVSDLADTLTDFHSSYKWEVGRRLALVALIKHYGVKHELYSGPRFSKMKIKGHKVILTFKFAGGLKTNDGKQPDNFSIAGIDGIFVSATAEIVENKVIIYATGLTKPVAVRFAWNEAAQPNLINNSGIPAFPFRTDGLPWKGKL